jgi:hypothetical protein
MKKLFPVVMTIVVTGLFACKPEKAFEDQPVEVKILGKWRVQQYIDNKYDKNGALIVSMDVDVTPVDSVLITHNMLYVSGPSFPDAEDAPYYFVNDSTLNIDDEIYKIRELTESTLYLYHYSPEAAWDGFFENKTRLRR